MKELTNLLSRVDGQAASQHGEPRHTQDVGAVIAADRSVLPTLVQSFENMVERYYYPPKEGEL